jgi:hypothetical protein
MWAMLQFPIKKSMVEYKMVNLSFRFVYPYAEGGTTVWNNVNCDVNGEGSIWEAIVEAYQKLYEHGPLKEQLRSVTLGGEWLQEVDQSLEGGKYKDELLTVNFSGPPPPTLRSQRGGRRRRRKSKRRKNTTKKSKRKSRRTRKKRSKY